MRILIAAVVLAAGVCSCSIHAPQRVQLPRVLLWAWQRPEALTFIDPQTTGVAYLAGTVTITHSGYTAFEPRLQPLAIAPGAPLVAVVRIESPPVHGPVDLAVLVAQLHTIENVAGLRVLQIDFDARASERTFYKSLLDRLSKSSAIPVSVTALISWCDGDRWLDHAPIMEAVPMFFRMGNDKRRELDVHGEICRSSIGLSTDEHWPRRRPPGIECVYLFSPRAWTLESYSNAMQRLRDWT
jgi:hypothetical protein